MPFKQEEFRKSIEELLANDTLPNDVKAEIIYNQALDMARFRENKIFNELSLLNRELIDRDF